MPGEPRNLGSLSRIYGPETWQVYEALDRSLDQTSTGACNRRRLW